MDAVGQFLPFILNGLEVTVSLSLLSVLVAVLLGLLGAWAKLSRSRSAWRVAEVYTVIVRGVPDLGVMLILYFGGQQLLNLVGATTGFWRYLALSEFSAGFLSIGFIFGAYMAETFRGAAQSIAKGHIEAGIALGLSRVLLFRLILWPQLVRYALPSFTNNWLSLMKTTALVSVIGLEDLVYDGYAAGKATRMPFTFLFVVLLLYLALTAISDVGLRWLNRRYEVYETIGGRS
jgi:His/Glu/Gln/Arg/opine family amino acid ABC transporter permease subunit